MMNIHKILLIASLFLAMLVQAQEFQTHTYYTNDSVSLELDLFLPAKSMGANTPLVIFVHGGGFSTGDRTGGNNLARYLVSRNIACATISYTLYMKDKSFGCDGILSEKIKAIQLGVNDLWRATAYLLWQGRQIRVDTSMIFLAGTSAGAEVVLHAAFWDREQMQMSEATLSSQFKYAGVIAGAGAIMDINLIQPDNQIPLMLFHGDADPVVPYGTAAHHYCPENSPGWLLLYGSGSIARHMQNLNSSCELITFKRGDHSYAGEYFYQNQQPVADFITRVLSGKKFFLTQTVLPRLP